MAGLPRSRPGEAQLCLDRNGSRGHARYCGSGPEAVRDVRWYIEIFHNLQRRQARLGLVEAHLSAIQQRRGISFQVIAEIVSLGDRKLNKKVFDTIDKYTARLTQLFADGVKTGEVGDDIDPSAAATLFFSMVQGLVSVWALSDCGFNLQERYKPIGQILRGSIVAGS